MLFLTNCIGIELVLWDFKLYLKSFVLTKGYYLNFFLILTNCVVVITEYLNSKQFQYQ